VNELWAYRIGVPLVRLLPRKLVYWCGLRIADRYFYRDHQGRSAVLSNLTHIFRSRGVTPSHEILEGLARKTYQYFGKNIVDFFRLSDMTSEQIRNMVSIEHEEYLRQTYEKGRGVILVSGHLGNWELGGSVLAAMGYPVSVVYLPQRLEKLNRLYEKHRKRHGVKVIPLGRSAWGIIQCLKQGETVALMGDRDFTASGWEAELFGKTTTMPRGPARLSVLTGAPVLPCYLLRMVDDTFLFRMHPPIWPDVDKSPESVQRKICRSLEREIGENPHQWFIFQDYWGTQP